MIKCYQEKYPETYISLSSRSVPVFWGHFSIVEAELICMGDLLRNNRSWKYATDLAGSEVVLFSNEELVRNLSFSSLPDIYVESCVLGHGHYRYSNKYALNQTLFYDPEEPGKYN